MSMRRERPENAPPADGRVAEFVARLRRAGLHPDAEQVAEALWLARWAAPEHTGARGGDPDRSGVHAAGAGAGGRPGPPGPGEDGPDEAARPPAPTADLPHDTRPARSLVSLYAPERHAGAPGRAFPVRAPVAGSLPGLLGLQRALRPLTGYRPQLPPAPGPLDEAATADASARAGAVRPVFGVAERGGVDVQLLMDASATASVWQLTFESLRQTCEQLGAFRDVQARYLHRAGDGTPLIGTGPDRATTRLRPADQYRDTTGRRITLVVSDCVGALWQDGRAQRLLHRWSGRSPLAVVQPLPPRLWPRTALPAEPGLLVRDRGADGYVTFERDGYGPPPEDDAVPVPVLLPNAAALGGWATLLGGNGRRTVRGAAAWVRPRHHAMPPPDAGARGRDPGPRELLDAFRATASVGALDLAVYLSAVPLVLPVIQLVQETMLPDTGPTELAEVLLSGLLERLPDIDRSPGPRYDFRPGVQELLLQSLDQGAAALVLKYLSDYVSRQFGRGTRNFPALAVERLTGRSPGGPRPAGAPREPGRSPRDQPADDLFAEIPARVVRWFEPDPQAPDDLAEARRLLGLWWEQGDPQLLHRARAHAENAVTAAGGDVDAREDPATGPGPDPQRAQALGRARLVLGQVLHALTDTGELRRDPARARALLYDAARQLTADDVETRFALAAVRHDLYQADGDTAHLEEAAAALTAMAADADAAGAPLPVSVEARRRLRLGRTLLALARAGGSGAAADHERTRAGAARAADELRAAADLMAGAGGDDRRLCAALLDLSGALREAGASTAQRLANLERAQAAAGDDDELRMRCHRARARVHRDAGDWRAADGAYAAAEKCTLRDSVERSGLLTEWGRMLLADTAETTRAEGLLREALTCAGAGPPTARLQLLLGRALVTRYAAERFLPDLYEGCHLLEQVARRGPDAGLRAEAWRRLGTARAELPAGRLPQDRAEEALDRAVAAAREARGGAPASVAVARALHARGDVRERRGRTAAALADYRAAAAEWRRLASRLSDGIPWDEVRATRAKLAGEEAG